MAEITIRFRRHPGTGRRELVIHLESDDDLLPHEHERDHRAIVEALIGQKLGLDTDIVVERIEKRGEGHGAAEPEALPERAAEKNRS
jgi:hypothetical protein